MTPWMGLPPASCPPVECRRQQEVSRGRDEERGPGGGEREAQSGAVTSGDRGGVRDPRTGPRIRGAIG
jgi:hypothetical protein